MSCAAVPGNSAAGFVTIALLMRAIILCLGAVAGSSCTRAAAVGLRVQITYCRHDVGRCQGQLFPHLPQKQQKHMSREGGSGSAMLSKRACCCCTVYTTSARRSGSAPNDKVKRGQKKVCFKGKQPGSRHADVTKHQKVKIIGVIKTVRDVWSLA